MLLGILKESAAGETRVALLPENLKSLRAQGIDVTVESGAGMAAGAADAAYVAVGATVTADRGAILAGADILPVVNALPAADQARLKQGAVVVGFLRPLDAPSDLATAIARPTTLFSMELVPRISRAQSMDALSSMATVAGYKAIVDAASLLPRMFPMLMTAAGTVPPARVFVIGAGVAGLQAIATARRLGAVVEAYDVRAAAGEQVRSLGAKFLDVDLGGINTEGGGGYAAELTEEALDRGRDLITKTAATLRRDCDDGAGAGTARTQTHSTRCSGSDAAWFGAGRSGRTGRRQLRADQAGRDANDWRRDVDGAAESASEVCQSMRASSTRATS